MRFKFAIYPLIFVLFITLFARPLGLVIAAETKTYNLEDEFKLINDRKAGKTTPVIKTATTTVVTQVKLVLPKSGDIFIQGKSNKISWTGGKDNVFVGLVDSNNDRLLYGLIKLDAKPNSFVTWDGKKLTSLAKTYKLPVPNPGTYRIIVASKDNLGNYTLGTTVNGVTTLGNVDYSNPFQIVEKTSIFKKTLQRLGAWIGGIFQ